MAIRISSYTNILALLPCFILGTLSFGPRLSAASDTIKFGQFLSGNQTIVSKGGRFELGFFTPGTSHKSYVGIWYKNIRKRTIIWVANREKPLPDSTSCALKISEANGSLIIVDQSNTTIWSSESTLKGSNQTVAVLLDTGNLVLKDLSSNVVWQSFDHPTDTVLPGAKIGFNRSTGQNWFLTSWRGLEDPAPGNYTLEIDPSGTSQYMMLWNRTQQYWTSGIWDGRIFSLIPEMMALHEFGFQHFSSANANYFTYSDSEANGVSGMLIDVTGRLNFQMWSFDTQDWVLFTLLPKDACDVFRFCGSFGVCTPFASPACECLQGFEPQNAKEWASGDQNGGCVRKTALQCSSNNNSTGGEKGGFLPVYVESLPINSLGLTAQNADECQASCLNDCSCTAYAYRSGCLIWKGDLVNLKKSPKTDGSSASLTVLYLHLASSEFTSPRRKKLVFHKALFGATAGLVALLCAIALFLVWNIRRKRLIGLNTTVQGVPVLYRYKDLHNATKNFYEKLGGGGFGSVYKGTLPDASVIAVKKLEGLQQGEKQFRMEVSAMAVVQHVNIVQLLGFCCEGTKRLLVYEYMDNGSLDSYLHERCRECIIHCDVKPENILLDSNFCPKVADFGMAKLMGRDFSRVLTTMRGTIGYLAPEWISGVPITAKADVYSFGMMLFEIASGRRNGKDCDSDGASGCGSFFPMWAATNIAERETLILSESKALKSTNIEEFGRACRVACWCIQDSEDNRPSMEQVVQMLEGNLDLGLPPIPRHLQNFIGNEKDIVYKLELYSATASEHLESI